MDAKIIYIMGVSGCGKTTIGKLLSHKTGWDFFDGDDYHPEENITKMKSGTPLVDEDRKAWLLELNSIARKQSENGKSALIGCSALKEDYRKLLIQEIKSPLHWIFLNGDYSSISRRLEQRNHFMPPDLLQSQFDILEPPKYGLHLHISQQPNEIINQIMEYLGL